MYRLVVYIVMSISSIMGWVQEANYPVDDGAYRKSKSTQPNLGDICRLVLSFGCG